MQILKAKKRELGKTINSSLRKDGKIPAVLYGKESQNQNMEILLTDFNLIYKIVGESEIFDLQLEGEDPVKVLVNNVQKNPVSDDIIHIDFWKINMNEKLEINIELNFVGESIAVKKMGGVLEKHMDTLTVKCLPKDLIKSLDVDISCLVKFDDNIKVKDLNVPSDIEVLDKGDLMVVSVCAPMDEKDSKEEETKSVEDVKALKEKGTKEEPQKEENKK